MCLSLAHEYIAYDIAKSPNGLQAIFLQVSYPLSMSITCQAISHIPFVCFVVLSIRSRIASLRINI